MLSIRPRAVAAALALACLLGASGCEWKAVSLQLPTFYSAGIQELWFWRLKEGGGGYVRTGSVKLLGIAWIDGRQQLRYTNVSPRGSESHVLMAPIRVERDSIVVSLNFARWTPPGWFRVTARNQAGESPLSAREVYF
jgi:hypothetical protein